MKKCNYLLGQTVLSLLVCCSTILFCSLSMAATIPEKEWSIERILDVNLLNTLSFVENGEYALYEGATLDLVSNTIIVKAFVKTMSTGVVAELTYGGKAVHQIKVHGSQVGFRSDIDGGHQIFSGHIEDGLLVGVKARTTSEGPILEWAWSSAGNYLAYTSVNITQDDLGIEQVGYVEPNQFYIVDMLGKTRQLPVHESMVDSFSWSPDEKKIVYDYYKLREHGQFEYDQVFMEHHYDIDEITIENGDIRQIAHLENGESTPLYSRSGSTIAYIVSETVVEEEMSRMNIVLYDTTTGVAQIAPVTSNEKPQLLGWGSTDSKLYFSEIDSVGCSLYSLNVQTMEIEKILFTGSLMPHFLLADDGDTITYINEGAQLPPELWLYDVEDKTNVPVTTANESLLSMQEIRTDIIEWKATDNTVIEGILVYPLNYDSSKKYPLIVYVHGGPADHAVDDFPNPLTDPYPTALFSQNGIFVLKPNIRGSDGYGALFRQKNVNDLGGADFQDILSGIDALVQKGMVDGDKLGIMGWSYGGFMTANAITKTDIFKAACVGAGPSNWVSTIGVTDVASTLENYMGGTIWQTEAEYVARSPLFHADKVTTPTLIIHGIEDTRVPYSQGLELYNGLHKNGVYVKMLGYPRSGHDISEPQLKLHYMNEVLDWFLGYLK